MAFRKKAMVSYMTLPLFAPKAEWVAPTEPPNLDEVQELGVDTETHDPELKIMGPGFLRQAAHTVGVSLATNDRQWYFPIGHSMENCQWEVERWLQDELMKDRKYIFANAQYDIEALWSIEVDVGGKWIDVLVDQALIDEEFEPGYSLDAVARHWLRGVGKSDDILLKHASHYGAKDITEAKQMMKYLPASAVGQYAEHDARITIDTAQKQADHITEQGLTAVVDLERDIMPLTWQMRRNGIRFDRENAERLNREWLLQEDELLKQIMHTGYRVDPWSGKSIAAYCDKVGIRYGKTPKGNPSFSKEFFQHKDLTLNTVGKYRALNKMRRDFIQTWLEFSEHDGRIHARWHQVASEEGGTRSGRFASSDPNLQQVPVRDPYYGPILRALFLPEEGGLFLKGDYSGQEIRVAIHYAFKLKCTGADAIVQRYLENKQFDFHGMVAEMAGIERVDAKTLALGSLYGMQARKAESSVGLDSESAAEAVENYFRIAPYFKELADIAISQATRKGYVKTFCGRRRRFRDPLDYHKALNAVIQGTSADMIKQAMVNVHQELGLVPLLTVHDELDYSVVDVESATQVVELMENALKLEVPMLIESKLGDHW